MNEQPKHNNTSHYWLDLIADQLSHGLKKGQKVTVSSGITPSGPYHVGHSREILTADALTRVCKERGFEVEHLHFVDAFDALRKRYPYLPESYEAEAGKPVYLVPAPDGISKSYATQYFNSYAEAARLLGIDMTVLWTHQEYQAGRYADIIVQTLQARDQIAAILERVSGRGVESDWQPVQILDETNNSLRTAEFLSFDLDAQTVLYRGSDGNEHVANMKLGQVKLDWRCDWPARWKLFNVTVEGFGREHATKGGSYDTGKAIVEEVYDGKAPIPVPYDTINLKGDTKKMSSSLGNLVTIQDALRIIPPEILRFFVFRSLPQKQINFDPAMGMYTMIDEVAKIETALAHGEDHEFARAWATAVLKPDSSAVARVPFSHLVTSYQSALGNVDTMLEILCRTGHSQAVEQQEAVLRREVIYLQRWLQYYAPEEVKFELLQDVPQLKLNPAESAFISGLQMALETGDYSAEAIHTTIYNQAQSANIEPRAAFVLLYRVFIGKDSGPKLGFFLASLGREFVLSRLSHLTAKGV